MVTCRFFFNLTTHDNYLLSLSLYISIYFSIIYSNGKYFCKSSITVWFLWSIILLIWAFLFENWAHIMTVFQSFSIRALLHTTVYISLKYNFLYLYEIYNNNVLEHHIFVIYLLYYVYIYYNNLGNIMFNWEIFILTSRL